jgi:hypothetical protein
VGTGVEMGSLSVKGIYILSKNKAQNLEKEATTLEPLGKEDIGSLFIVSLTLILVTRHRHGPIVLFLSER